jgi:hypothetical protein
MNRRGFLGMMVGGVALGAARTFPFRVYSFASQIEQPKLKVYSFKDLQGTLEGNLSWDGFLASGVQLDAIAKIHGVARMYKGSAADFYIESDQALRARVLAARFQNGLWVEEGK